MEQSTLEAINVARVILGPTIPPIAIDIAAMPVVQNEVAITANTEGVAEKRKNTTINTLENIILNIRNIKEKTITITIAHLGMKSQQMMMNVAILV
jgi:hypothetical protein